MSPFCTPRCCARTAAFSIYSLPCETEAIDRTTSKDLGWRFLFGLSRGISGRFGIGCIRGSDPSQKTGHEAKGTSSPWTGRGFKTIIADSVIQCQTTKGNAGLACKTLRGRQLESSSSQTPSSLFWHPDAYL